MVVVPGVTVVLPLTGWLPFHPPEAVHEAAFVLDQVRVEDWPDVMVVGLAVIETVGAMSAATFTVALLLAVPPLPLQLSV